MPILDFLREMWNEDGYDKWSSTKHNNIVLANQEAIYLGIIVAVMFAVITYGLELATLIITDFFKVGLSEYVLLPAKIIILLVILSIYINYVQFLQYKKSKTK